VGTGHVDGQNVLEGRGIGAEDSARHVQAGIGHHDLDLAEGVDRGGGEPLDRVVVGEVEVDGDRFAAGLPDGDRRVLAVGDASAPSTTGWPSAARAAAVARPMPDEAPVTTAGRRCGFAGNSASAQGHRCGQGGEAPDVDGVDPLDPVRSTS